jgi:hypothetical protein
VATAWPVGKHCSRSGSWAGYGVQAASAIGRCTDAAWRTCINSESMLSPAHHCLVCLPISSGARSALSRWSGMAVCHYHRCSMPHYLDCLPLCRNGHHWPGALARQHDKLSYDPTNTGSSWPARPQDRCCACCCAQARCCQHCQPRPARACQHLPAHGASAAAQGNTSRWCAMASAQGKTQTPARAPQTDLTAASCCTIHTNVSSPCTA